MCVYGDQRSIARKPVKAYAVTTYPIDVNRLYFKFQPSNSIPNTKTYSNCLAKLFFVAQARLCSLFRVLTTIIVIIIWNSNKMWMIRNLNYQTSYISIYCAQVVLVKSCKTAVSYEQALNWSYIIHYDIFIRTITKKTYSIEFHSQLQKQPH